LPAEFKQKCTHALNKKRKSSRFFRFEVENTSPTGAMLPTFRCAEPQRGKKEKVMKTTTGFRHSLKSRDPKKAGKEEKEFFSRRRNMGQKKTKKGGIILAASF